MKFTISEVVYYPGNNRVIIGTRHDFGTQTVETTQNALQQRAGESPWTDADIQAEAQAQFDKQFSDQGHKVVLPPVPESAKDDDVADATSNPAAD